MSKLQLGSKFFCVLLGYSMGCTQLLILLSERPEYNRKIAAAFLLGCVVYMTNSKDDPRNFMESTLAAHFERKLKFLGIYE